MTWTYSGNPSDSEKDEVRFLIGDTDSTDEQLQDEEIAYLVADNGSPLAAAVAGCKVLAAKYARLADQKTGDISVSYSQRFDHYQKLAASLKVRLATRSGTPYAGGISKSDRDQDILDSDRVDPAFDVGEMDFDGRDTKSDLSGTGQ